MRALKLIDMKAHSQIGQEPTWRLKSTFESHFLNNYQGTIFNSSTNLYFTFINLTSSFFDLPGVFIYLETVMLKKHCFVFIAFFCFVKYIMTNTTLFRPDWISGYVNQHQEE